MISGWSQGGTGYSAAPLVILDGTNAGFGAAGLALEAGSDGSTINGVVINSFSDAGISIGSTFNTIEGSYLGTNADGTAAGSQPMVYGVLVTAASNTIGGVIAVDRNVISGNADAGVAIAGSGASGNVLEGNYIGTDITGTEPLGNGTVGIYISGSLDNTIGGTTSGAGNVISANGAGGVYINAASDNVIAGDLIGTNLAGTVALGNGGDGVEVAGGSTGNTIGGGAVAARNIISGNIEAGVEIAGTGTSSNFVAGNFIGTDVSGTYAIDNFAGVEIDGGALRQPDRNQRRRSRRFARTKRPLRQPLRRSLDRGFRHQQQRGRGQRNRHNRFRLGRAGERPRLAI